MNPYRIAENVVAILIGLVVLAVLGTIAWLITITESWEWVGITIIVIAGFFGLAILQQEWESIGDWWVRKRDAWDAKHSPTGEKHGE